MKYQTNFLPHQKFNFLQNNKKVIQNITKKSHFVLICILYLNKKTLRKSFIAYLDRRWANFCCLKLIWKTFENVPVGFPHSQQIEQHLVQSPFSVKSLNFYTAVHPVLELLWIWIAWKSDLVIFIFACLFS